MMKMKWKKMALPLALSVLPLATGVTVPQDTNVMLSVCEAKTADAAEAPGVARRAPRAVQHELALLPRRARASGSPVVR